PGQWYLHLYDTSQPDWNWHHPDVPALFEDVIRFWLDRGVAGLRVDVAHGIVKDPGLPDLTGPQPLNAPSAYRHRARAAAAFPVLAGHPGLLPGRGLPRAADRRRRGLVRRGGDARAVPPARRPAAG